MVLSGPAAVALGHFAVSDHGVGGFAFGSDEWEIEVFFPCFGHGSASVATPGFANGISGENGGIEFGKVAFMKNGNRCCHDVTAVIEHECMFVGMSEKVVGQDGLARTGVDFRDVVSGGVEPDQCGVAFGGLFGNPSGVGFVILSTSGIVSGFVNQPDERRIFSVSGADFRHTQGGSTNKIGPPTVMAIILNPVIFPSAESRASANNDVLGIRQRREKDQ